MLIKIKNLRIRIVNIIKGWKIIAKGIKTDGKNKLIIRVNDFRLKFFLSFFN